MEDELPGWVQGLGTDAKEPEETAIRKSFKISRKYDLFISYKSESVAIVRPVAEALQANSLRVWFNEYEFTKSYYWENDTVLSASLKMAATSSAAAVLFINNAWAKSYWCGVEMNCLIKELPRERLLVVDLPQDGHDSAELRDRKAQLSGCRSIAYTGLQDVIDALNDLGWFPRKLKRPAVNPCKRILKNRHFNITMLEGSLCAGIGAKMLSFRKTGTIEDREVLSTTLNGCNANWQIAYHPTRTLDYLKKIPNLLAAEDKEIFRELVPFADWWVREGRGDHDSGGELAGIHLVKVPYLLRGADAGRGHFGATLRVDYGSQNNKVAWIRKYCFIIPNDIACGELDIDFVFYLSKENKEAERKQFCELIGYTDEIVNSLSCFIYLA